MPAAARGVRGRGERAPEPGSTERTRSILRNTCGHVPDQPVTKFHLELFGGKRGLIVLSAGLCKSPKASVSLTGQNGKAYDTDPVVRTGCKGSKKGKNGGGKQGHGNDG